MNKQRHIMSNIKMHRLTKAKKRFIKTAVMHLIALGVALCIFALPHHVLRVEKQSTGIKSERGVSSQTEETEEDPLPVQPEYVQPAEETVAGTEEVSQTISDNSTDESGYSVINSKTNS